MFIVAVSSVTLRGFVREVVIRPVVQNLISVFKKGEKLHEED